MGSIEGYDRKEAKESLKERGGKARETLQIHKITEDWCKSNCRKI